MFVCNRFHRQLNGRYCSKSDDTHTFVVVHKKQENTSSESICLIKYKNFVENIFYIETFLSRYNNKKKNIESCSEDDVLSINKSRFLKHMKNPTGFLCVYSIQFDSKKRKTFARWTINFIDFHLLSIRCQLNILNQSNSKYGI